MQNQQQDDVDMSSQGVESQQLDAELLQSDMALYLTLKQDDHEVPTLEHVTFLKQIALGEKKAFLKRLVRRLDDCLVKICSINGSMLHDAMSNCKLSASYLPDNKVKGYASHAANVANTLSSGRLEDYIAFVELKRRELQKAERIQPEQIVADMSEDDKQLLATIVSQRKTVDKLPKSKRRKNQKTVNLVQKVNKPSQPDDELLEAKANGLSSSEWLEIIQRHFPKAETTTYSTRFSRITNDEKSITIKSVFTKRVKQSTCKKGELYHWITNLDEEDASTYATNLDVSTQTHFVEQRILFTSQDPDSSEPSGASQAVSQQPGQELKSLAEVLVSESAQVDVELMDSYHSSVAVLARRDARICFPATVHQMVGSLVHNPKLCTIKCVLCQRAYSIDGGAFILTDCGCFCCDTCFEADEEFESCPNCEKESRNLSRAVWFEVWRELLQQKKAIDPHLFMYVHHIQSCQSKLVLRKRQMDQNAEEFHQVLKAVQGQESSLTHEQVVLLVQRSRFNSVEELFGNFQVTQASLKEGFYVTVKQLAYWKSKLSGFSDAFQSQINKALQWIQDHDAKYSSSQLTNVIRNQEEAEEEEEEEDLQFSDISMASVVDSNQKFSHQNSLYDPTVTARSGPTSRRSRGSSKNGGRGFQPHRRSKSRDDSFPKGRSESHDNAANHRRQPENRPVSETETEMSRYQNPQHRDKQLSTPQEADLALAKHLAEVKAKEEKALFEERLAKLQAQKEEESQLKAEQEAKSKVEQAQAEQEAKYEVEQAEVVSDRSDGPSDTLMD